MINRIGLKTIVAAGTVTIIYLLSAFLAFMKLISHQSNGYDGFIASPFLFLTGLVFFLARAESLLESDHGAAFVLFKLAANKKAGLLYASIIYKLIGLGFMLISIVITLAILLTRVQ